MSIEPFKPALNDDPEVDHEELIEASDDTSINDGELHAPETDARTEDLVAWDDLPGDTGHKTPTTPLEDEVKPSETLVNEGIEEAEREQRMAAADPDFE